MEPFVFLAVATALLPTVLRICGQEDLGALTCRIDFDNMVLSYQQLLEQKSVRLKDRMVDYPKPPLSPWLRRIPKPHWLPMTRLNCLGCSSSHRRRRAAPRNLCGL